MSAIKLVLIAEPKPIFYKDRGRRGINEKAGFYIIMPIKKM